jgi:hydroxyacylglutathione hydrolase
MLTIKSFEFNPVQENTYVLSGEKDACCIIDPGCYFGNERTALKEHIEQQGLSPEWLLNTHCHLDHVFGNQFVAETWDLPLHLHEKEQPVLAMAPAMGLQWGMPFENYRGELIYLVPGRSVMLGEDELEILFLPGTLRAALVFIAGTRLSYRGRCAFQGQHWPHGPAGRRPRYPAAEYPREIMALAG